MSSGWGHSDWVPKPEYTSEADNLAEDFHGRALISATRYDRITGFFSSGALLLYWHPFKGFAERGGKMRLLCSPRLSAIDAEGLVSGYQARDDASVQDQLLAELEALLNEERLRAPGRAFAALVAAGVIEVRLATVAVDATASDKRMFHDKTGLFFDDAERAIGFRGSANETLLGLSPHGNIESLDAWPSWTGDRDSQRVCSAISRFERLWAGEVDGVQVARLAEDFVIKLREATNGEPWPELVDEAAAVQQRSDQTARPTTPDGRPLRDQQVDGLAAWRLNEYRGVLAHATGSGKTVTGICAVHEHAGPALVIVPSELVASQWTSELRRLLPDRPIHLAGGGDTRWRTRLRQWVSDAESHHVIVALTNTASDEAFRNLLLGNRELLLIGDEVHRLGAPTFRSVLGISAARRLGLSATPERAGDPEGTAAIFEYFGPVIDRYTLRDAQRAGALCEYLYYPQVVHLDEDELNEWKELGKKIGRALAVAGAQDSRSAATALIMKRARVAKQAAAKVPAAVNIVVRDFEPRQHWLVYCDDQQQMMSVADQLTAKRLPVYTYFSAMAGDKNRTLQHFSRSGGVVVSIKCLDEGVDIPECDHAVILASSQNPREFIQRRGRVLRANPTKSFATIHDLLAVPQGQIDDGTRTLVWAEIARASEFARYALNSSARLPLEAACEALGVDLADLYDTLGGLEADAEES